MTLDILKIIWTVAALLGAAYATVALIDTIKDSVLVHRRKLTNGRRLISQIHLRTASSRLLLMIAMAVFGAGNVLHLFGRGDQIWIDVVWIAITLIFTLCAIIDTHSYSKLLKEHTT